VIAASLLVTLALLPAYIKKHCKLTVG
jgi:hypothetical protein